MICKAGIVLKSYANRLFLFMALAILFLYGCKEDYMPFDTKPAFEISKPKIRFVNLHFSKTLLTLNIGNGKLIKSNLRYRELTAYEEAPDFLTEGTPFFIADETGAILLRDTISTSEGNNYTFFVSPAYIGTWTNYQITTPGSPKSRYMASLLTDKVGYAFIADPVSSALADRASVRQITFSPPLRAEALPYFISATPENKKPNQPFSYIPARTENAPDFSSSLSFINFGYDVATPDHYNFFWGSFTATGINNQPETGKTLNLGVRQPFTLEAGKSYTVITNGTVGESNDIEDANAVIPSSSNNPLILKPIPYEAFILDDSDGSARTLKPMPLERISRQVAILNFIDLNYQWKSANPTELLVPRINGVLPRPGGVNGSVTFESEAFGDQVVDVAVANLSRPLLASTKASFAANGKYLVFHYLDNDNTPKVKVLEADTVVKYDSPIRVNFANFCPDLEPVSIKNLETGEILISEIKFTDMSKSIELPVERYFIGTKAVLENVYKLAAIRPGTEEVMFEIDLTQDYYDGTTNLIFNEASQGQRNSAFIYTVIFSGRYNAVDEGEKFRKTILALERADKPTHNYESIFDWRILYGELP